PSTAAAPRSAGRPTPRDGRTSAPPISRSRPTTPARPTSTAIWPASPSTAMRSPASSSECQGVRRGPVALAAGVRRHDDEGMTTAARHWDVRLELIESEDYCEVVAHLDAGDRGLSGTGRS